MRLEEIKQMDVASLDPAGASSEMLPGEIHGASVFYHRLTGGQRAQFAGTDRYCAIFFLLEGSAGFEADGKSWRYDERAVFADDPKRDVAVTAVSDCAFLEIRWNMSAADLRELSNSAASLPFTQKYLDAIQYREQFKSAKTISRAIIPQRIFPRFAMGSVETHDADQVGSHAHPLLDQFFFSFPENQMTVLIDDVRLPYGGNTLLHIPLGSSHGIDVADGETAHYIWIDFIFDEEGVAFLDQVHHQTDEKRAF